MYIVYPEWKRRVDTIDTYDFTKTELDLLQRIKEFFTILETLTDVQTTKQKNYIPHIIITTAIISATIALAVRHWVF